jgi:MFS family permease
MKYLSEFRRSWRPLLAASLGCSVSLPLFAYTNSAFAPHLVAEFGWSRAQFALVGLATLSTLLVMPLIGRFTDRYGVLRVALVGTFLVPLGIASYSLMTGSFSQYVMIFVVVLALGSMTGPLVYTRLVAEYFVRARGLGLTVVNSAPALMAMLAVPLLNQSILDNGWRSTYLLLAGLTLAISIVAVLLIPRRPAPKDRLVAAPEEPPAPVLSSKEAFSIILRSGLFWLIIVATILCMIQTQLHASQMNLMLIDNGLTTSAAAGIVSIYAFSTILGRIGCGLALDRWSTPIVTFVSMILPAMGFFLLATPYDSYWAIVLAMFLAGLSMGAESDLVAYLVARYFHLRIYNTVLSLLMSATFLASAMGSLLISASLREFGSFSPFLYGISFAILAGSFMFLAMPRGDTRKVGDHADEPTDLPAAKA